MLAPWIIAHFPAHRVYVEPYGGAASVLLRKERSYAEIYNDLDVEVVNLFRVLRSSQAPDLIAALELTPFARGEFELSYQETKDPVERARRLVVRSFMGFGSDGHNAQVRTGFRAASNRSGTTPAHDWRNLRDCYRLIVDRLDGVVIECRPAVDVMRRHDGPDTLHYVDPPYMPETRSNKSRRGKLRYHAYSHEMTARQHAHLMTALRSLTGMVALSGYASALYEKRLTGWRRVEIAALADGARKRTEVLWLNPACVAALGHGPLFDRIGDAA
jgi:DNA adenine methylase